MEAAAHKKHGGAEGLEEARKSSIDHRQEKRAAKRKEDNEKVGPWNVNIPLLLLRFHPG